jgi:hypothetical protein
VVLSLGGSCAKPEFLGDGDFFSNARQRNAPVVANALKSASPGSRLRMCGEEVPDDVV